MRASRWLGVAGPFAGFLLVELIFALSPELRGTVFTAGNFKLVLQQTVITGLGALGMTVIIIAGGIDLSVGSAVALLTVVGVKALLAGLSVPLASLLFVAGGCLIGAVNGGLIAGLRLLPFIITLGMMGILRGGAKWLSNNQVVYAPQGSSIVRFMERVQPNEFLPLPIGVWITLALGMVLHLILHRTVFGRHVFALGANPLAARLSGVRITRTQLAVYTLAGGFFGMAALMQLSRLTGGDPTIAVGLELDMIAAVVIGGASLNGGSGSVVGSLVGALTMTALRNGLGQTAMGNYLQEIIIGAVIVLAVALDKWRQTKAAAARA